MRLAGLLVVLASGTAYAYPEFQLSTGATRCSECHISPAGGGLLADYGRDEAGSTISSGGDGRFLHGIVELPSWLALGGDVRIAALAKTIRTGREAAVFPMQADGYVHAGMAGVSIDATVGVLDAIRDPMTPHEQIGSREHYVMYRSESNTWYVRAGRMFPVWGLRLPDHTAYVRRYTDLYLLEESYAFGGGIAAGAWQVDASVLTPLELAPEVGRHGWGGSLQAERADDTTSISIATRAMRTDTGMQSWLAATGKLWLEDASVLLAIELDGGLAHTTGGEIGQLAGYAAIYVHPGRVWSVAAAAHYFDADLRLHGDGRAAFDVQAAWFARAHVELATLIRASTVAFDVARRDILGLVQLHYYL